MELYINRVYGKSGTNGTFTKEDGTAICHTIELPSLQNKRQVSCINEGRYRFKIEDSPAHGICLELLNVPGRGDIQFHRANWAKKDLKGCVGPVSRLEPGTYGVGWGSADALKKVEDLIFPELKAGREVWVTFRKATKLNS